MVNALAVLLLAVAAGTPAPTPTSTPAPVAKAETGQTRTLSDIARERKLGKKGVPGGTLSVAGAPIPKAAQASIAAGHTVDAEEAMWTKRNADARDELDAAQAALWQADAALPPAVAYGYGARASAAIQNQIRESTLLPYRTRVAAAQAKVDALPEEARKAGAQPGWVR
jgi:hypothetical protein